MIDIGIHRLGRAPARQRGVTLIELMVALTIAAILTAGAVQIFQSARGGFRNNEALSRVQENGRFAVHFLTKEIRSADSFGCSQQPEVTSQLNSGGGFSFGGPTVDGTDGNGINIITATGASDSLTIRGTTTKQNLNLSNKINAGENVQVQEPNPPVKKGDILMITDCESADVFQVSSTPSGSAITHNSGGSVSPGNNSKDFSQGYGSDANVFSARVVTYSLVDSGDGPQLVRERNGDTEVLLDNVVDLQFLFGEDINNNNSPNYYVPANQVADMGRVVAIRSRITVRSNEQNITPEPMQIDFDGDGTTETAPDNRLYRIITATTAIRNRLP